MFPAPSLKAKGGPTTINNVVRVPNKVIGEALFIIIIESGTIGKLVPFQTMSPCSVTSVTGLVYAFVHRMCKPLLFVLSKLFLYFIYLSFYAFPEADTD